MKKFLLLALAVLGGVGSVYSQREIPNSFRIYFKNSSGWSGDLYIYAYKNDADINEAWPGKKITDNTFVYDGDTWYYADFDYATYGDKFSIIVNNNKYQTEHWDNVKCDLWLESQGANGTETMNRWSMWYLYDTDTKISKLLVKNGDEYSTIIDNLTSPENHNYLMAKTDAYNWGTEANYYMYNNARRPYNNDDETFSFQNTENKYVYQSETNGVWKTSATNPAMYKFIFNGSTWYYKYEAYITTTLSAPYATFSSDYNVAIPSGLTAYYASAKSGNAVTMTAFENGIASDQGAFLAGAAGTYKFTPATTTDAVSTNYLKKGTSSFTGGDNSYVFAEQSGDYGFFKYSGTAVDMTGKAYLDLTGAGARVSFAFADEASGISSAVATASAAEGCFDLQGRRVAKPAKGLYIVNGKKQIIK